MKLIAVLNHSVPLGYVLNALAHMTAGLGHHLQGEPNIEVYFGSTEQVRQFCHLSRETSRLTSLHSDFPDTMIGGDTDNQLELAKATPEHALIYYGVCHCAEDTTPAIDSVLEQLTVLEDYTPYHTKTDDCSIQSAHHCDESSAHENKFALLINYKLPLAETINDLISASLAVGQKAACSELKLVDIIDKDGIKHPNISFHPYPVLKPDSVKKMADVIDTAKTNPEIISAAGFNAAGTPTSGVFFSQRHIVDQLITRKNSRLYNETLKPESLKAYKLR